jgi:hypothetical protein
MTNNLYSSKLPIPIASESNRRDGGKFFPLPSFATKQGTASFESLIPKNEGKEKRDEEAEELAAAKKRKKALEQVDPQAPTLDPSAPIALCVTPDLAAPTSKEEFSKEATKANAETPLAGDEFPVKTASTEVDKDTRAAQSDQSPKASEESFSSHAKNIENTESEFNHAIDHSIQPTSHGIENAPNDSEMISIATSDAMEFGVTPLNGASPASPPVANSMAAAMAEESSVSPIGAAGGSAESSLGNFSQGAGASGVPLFNNLSSKISRTSEVTTVLKTLSVEVEKLKQTGQSQIDLELPISDTESVKIRLQVRGEEIRSVFITESPELRNALQKSWGEFAQTSRERGFRFGDPTFQNPSSENNSPSQQGQQQRQDRNQQTDTATYPGYNISRQQPQRTTTSPAPGNSVSLWA